ncbi:MAG: C1 family peptidase [Pseudomonadota bacterium]|nr:C1 family peptidase [Pseudomonadota bacterium]
MMLVEKKGFPVWNKLVAMFVFVLGSLFLFSGAVVGAEKIPFSQDETISEIREKIVTNGYKFTVADNWVTRLPLAERHKLLSRHAPLSPNYRSGSADFGPLRVLSEDELPESFDWRDFEGRSYIGPVRNQGSCGACYAFGACAAAEGTYNVALGKYDFDCLDLSEAFLAFCLDQYYDGYSGCEGSDYDYRELAALVERGVCLEEAYPYTGVDQGCVAGSEEAVRVKFSGWHRISCGDIAAIKSAIMTYGVLDAAVEVTSAFEAYQSGVFSDSNTECDSEPCYYTSTNHCVALVGWQDTNTKGGGYWILRNSWGSSWGEDGYMRIAYRSAHVACETCYMVYNGSEIETPEDIFVNYDGFCNGASPCFSTISAAYVSAGSDSKIKVRSGYFYCRDGVVFDQDKNLSLTGGWNEEYSDASSFTCIFGGSLEIQHGCVVVSRFILGNATKFCRNDDYCSGFLLDLKP